MQSVQNLDTTLIPLCLEDSDIPFTQAFDLRAKIGCCDKGHLSFITDKALYIAVNEMEAEDDWAQEALIDALHHEAIEKRIWQVRWHLSDQTLQKWASNLTARGYQLSENGTARWKNPSFNIDIAMGI